MTWRMIYATGWRLLSVSSPTAKTTSNASSTTSTKSANPHIEEVRPQNLHRLAQPEVQQTMQSRAAGFCRRQKKGSAGNESRSVLPKAKKPCWSAVARETPHLHRLAQPEVQQTIAVERSRLPA